MTGEETISEAALKLRIRSNIIDYLEIAASPEEQRAFERRVPIAKIPDEMINLWEDCVPDANFEWFSQPEFSAHERLAIERFYAVWDSVADNTPDVLPDRIDDLIGTAVWQLLIDGAGEALTVFRVRGRIDEGAAI